MNKKVENVRIKAAAAKKSKIFSISDEKNSIQGLTNGERCGIISTLPEYGRHARVAELADAHV